MSNPWTLDAIERTAELLREGFTASYIASQLSGVSRNAVIGKVRRHPVLCKIGFTRRPNGSQGSGVERGARKRPDPARKPRPKVSKAPGKYKLAPTPEAIVMRRLSILDVGRLQCRWPVEGEGASMICCGADVDPKCPRLECPTHYRMSSGSPRATHERVEAAAEREPFVRRAG